MVALKLRTGGSIWPGIIIDAADAVDAVLLHKFVIVVEVLNEYVLVAHRAEEDFHVVVEGLEVLLAQVVVVLGEDVVHEAAEEAAVREEVLVLHADAAGLHAAHGETGHRAVLAVGEGAVAMVDVGDDVLCQQVFDERGVEAALLLRKVMVGNHAVQHDNDHRLGFALRDECVHDEVHLALAYPAGFIFTMTMLEVENREAGLGLGVISGRKVDLEALETVGDLAVKKVYRDRAVRRFGCTIVHVLFGNLDVVDRLVAAKADEEIAADNSVTIDDDAHGNEPVAHLEGAGEILAFFGERQLVSIPVDRDGRGVGVVEREANAAVLEAKGFGESGSYINSRP